MSKTKDVVTLMEKEWPVMTAEFRKLQREQYELFLHKQHDYGPGNISVGTQLKTPEEYDLKLKLDKQLNLLCYQYCLYSHFEK